jgi:hypothetical protein
MNEVPEDQKPEASHDASSRLAILENRLDSLIAARKPWYRDTTLLAQITAIAAFAMSVVTTTIAAYRTHRQDVNTIKTELRTIISQLHDHGVALGEFKIKYKDNLLLDSITGDMYESDIQLARRAYYVVKELGTDASAYDFIETAYFLHNVGEIDLADELAGRGIDAAAKAANFADHLASIRQLGRSKLQAGRVAESEVYMQEALQIFQIYPKAAQNEYFVNSTHAYTLLRFAEVNPLDCRKVLEYTDIAANYISKSGNSMQNYNAERDQVRSRCISQPEAPQLSNPPDSATPPMKQPTLRPVPKFSRPRP